MMVPSTMETMLSRRAMRPRRRAPSMSPCCPLFLDWGEAQREAAEKGSGAMLWLQTPK